MENPNLPLEKILTERMEEARKLFSKDLAITARYVLSTVKEKCRLENLSVPEELDALQEDFDRSVKKDYPKRMMSALKSSDYKRAATLFSAFVGYVYNGRVPEYLEGLQEDIRKGNI